MNCALGLVFCGAEGVGSRFHVLRARTHFLRYRGRLCPFSCLARPNLFSTVPRASGPVLIFCTLKFIFGCNEGVGSRFHFFARPDSFSAVLWVSAPIFMFCAPELIFGGTEGVGSHFHVLRARTLILMFSTPGLIFGCTEGVRSRFHVLRARTRFWPYRGRRVPFTCFWR
jgi:hypothetical protein